jgi:hypothetical protein
MGTRSSAALRLQLLRRCLLCQIQKDITVPQEI